MGLIKKLRKAKKEAPAGEKPAIVKTHLRNMIVYVSFPCLVCLLKIATDYPSLSLCHAVVDCADTPR